VPTISAFYGIIISMNFAPAEHPPPHFHAQHAEHQAQIDIRSGKVIAGKLPPRQAKLIRAWTDMHRDELMANWNLAMNRQKLFPVAPLK